MTKYHVLTALLQTEAMCSISQTLVYHFHTGNSALLGLWHLSSFWHTRVRPPGSCVTTLSN